MIAITTNNSIKVNADRTDRAVRAERIRGSSKRVAK